MYRRRIKRPPPPVFGGTLEEMNYTINENGQLVDNEGKQYAFDLKAKDRDYQEAHARALTEAVMNVMIKRMEDECGMVRATVPLNVTDIASPHATILLSSDARECKRLMVLVPGTMETLGSWSRRLLANHHVEIGSMLSVVRRAREEGYGVVISNPNTHWWVDGRASMVVPLSTRKEFIMIPDSTSPEEHVDYVLRNYVQNFASREIHFVAHKYGAHALIQALHAQFEKFKDRVSAIAVVDGTHTIAAYPEPEFRKWWFLNAAGYIQSDVDDRGKVIYREHAGCNCVKAGTTEYDFTIVDGMSDIFRFFNSRKDRDNTFDKRKDLLPPRDENDPTTAMIVKDEDINSEDSIK